MKQPTLALQLAEEVRAEPKECYRNAALALLMFCADPTRYYRFGEIPKRAHRAYYVEGILSIMEGGLHIDHGWLEIGGVVVDPTLHDQIAIDYVAVVRYTQSDVLARVNGGQELPFFIRDAEKRRLMAETMRGRYESSINGRDVRGELAESSGVGSGHGEG